MASDEYLARIDEHMRLGNERMTSIDKHMRRGNELMEQIRAEAAEREKRYRADAAERERMEAEREQRYCEEVAITREVIRRNETAFREGSRLHANLVESLRELRAEIRDDRRQLREDAKAQTQAIFRLLDRLGGGPEPAGA